MDKKEVIANEEMNTNAVIGDFIRDYQESDDPKFEGLDKEKRKQLAITAWLDFKRKRKNK